MRPHYLSPLRYPGGKARIAPYLTRLIKEQPRRPSVYSEPFAGGSGAALRLLVDETVRSIQINDLSPGVAAFWRCTFFDTERFAQLIESAEVTLDQWYEAKRIFETPQGHDDLVLGYATFFLNRCNRSGILTARPIGGLEQAGNWKIDARFNRLDLAARVRFIGAYRRRVQVTQLDARDFIQTIEPMAANVFVYVDPPYIVQGEDLYLDSLSYQDHKDLALQLCKSSFPWMLTYDVNEQITNDLYSGLRTAEFSIAHTAQMQHVGSEYIVFGPQLIVPSINILNGANARWIAV